MRFAFDDSQTMLQDMLRGALEREAPLERLRRWADDADFGPFDAVARANGWAGIGTDEAAGGQGGGVVEQALLFEALGHQAAPSGRLFVQVAALGLATAAGVDGAELGALVDDGSVALFDAGRALDAQRDGVHADGGRLNGEVARALGVASGAGGWLLPVADGSGVGLWRVAAAADGATVAPRAMVDRTRPLADVSLARVPARCIGRLDAAALGAVHARLAVLLAAESLGLARRMLAMTVDYVGQRVQFGVPVGSFQAVKHEAAQVLVDVEAAHSGIYHAAWALDEREPDAPLNAWIAKAFACETAARTADRALMLHGAIGYTLEYDLQFFFKRAKLNVELLGSPRHHRERIASALSLVPDPSTRC